MTPRRTTTRNGAGAAALTVVVVVIVALALMFLVRASPSPGAYDPRSGEPDGLRGLVLLLERYGATVRFGDDVPVPGSDGRVVVVGNGLGDEQRDALNEFVAGGGIAVVADASSPYQSSPTGDPDAPQVDSVASDFGGEIDEADPVDFQSTVPLGICTIGALGHLRGLAIEYPTAFEVLTPSMSCFGDRDLAVVRATVSGDGTLVTIGDSSLFTNRWLEFGDNPGVATALLAPTPGTTVTIVLGDGPRSAALPDSVGDDRLIDLVRPSVWMGLAQLAIAFVVLSIAVGVRPGRVVDEPALSPLEGSALVIATGNLMQRGAHAERAAQLLRYDVHRRLCARFGIAPSAPLSVLDQELVRRGLAAPGDLIVALSGPPPRTSADLAALARRLQPFSELAEVPPGELIAPTRN